MVTIEAMGFKPSDNWGGIATDYEGQLYEKTFMRLHVRPGGTILIYIFNKMMGVVADDSHGKLVLAIQECIDDFIDINKESIGRIKKLIEVMDSLESELKEVEKGRYIWALDS